MKVTPPSVQSEPIKTAPLRRSRCTSTLFLWMCNLFWPRHQWVASPFGMCRSTARRTHWTLFLNFPWMNDYSWHRRFICFAEISQAKCTVQFLLAHPVYIQSRCKPEWGLSKYPNEAHKNLSCSLPLWTVDLFTSTGPFASVCPVTPTSE